MILFLIVLLGAFLRLYNAPLRYGLGEETVRDAVIGIEAARQLQLPLTGSFSSLGPFTFGPLYAYQVAFASILIPSSYAPWIYLTIISVAYIPVMFLLGKKLFDEKFGLLLAFLSAISPAQIISATHLTPHNATNIFASSTILLFLILLKDKKRTYLNFILGLIIGTSMNLHFQMAGLMLFPIILLLLNRKVKPILLSLLGIFVTFIPYLLFELNNHWFNTRNIIYFLVHDRWKIAVPNRWLTYLTEFWPGFWGDTLGIPPYVAAIFMISFGIIASFLLYKRKISKSFIFLIIVFLFSFISLRYYFGPRFYGYLNFLRPYVFIFTAFTIYFLWTKKNLALKITAVVVLLALAVLPIERIKLDMKKDIFSINMYEISKIIQAKTNKSYAIFECPMKEYDSKYNGQVMSQVFLADHSQSYSKSGKKIGIVHKNCQIPKGAIIIGKKEDLKIADLTKIPEKKLQNLRWRPITFRSIYDNYAMWWLNK